MAVLHVTIDLEEGLQVSRGGSDKSCGLKWLGCREPLDGPEFCDGARVGGEVGRLSSGGWRLCADGG